MVPLSPSGNLDLTVGRGESVGLVGESGSGKTMAIRANSGPATPAGRLVMREHMV